MADYPSSITSFTTKVDGVDDVMAVDINKPQAEIVAIETELGTDPKGTSASVKERLAGIRSLSGASTDTLQVTGSDVYLGNDLRLTGGISAGSQAVDPAAGAIVATGDIYTAPWTDYSATSTIVGFSAFSTKRIYYKRVGKLVFVNVVLVGTSNSTSTTFTVYYNNNTVGEVQTLFHGINNGTDITGLLDLPDGSTIVTCYSSIASAAWTNSGTKAVLVQFWYEANA